MNQKELALRFSRGATSGSASNLSIVPNPDHEGITHLVGYGWAVYATRNEAGDVLIYEDAWCEWSREQGGNTTQCQFSRIKAGFRETLGNDSFERQISLEDHEKYIFSDKRPELGDEPQCAQLIGRRQMR